VTAKDDGGRSDGNDQQVTTGKRGRHQQSFLSDEEAEAEFDERVEPHVKKPTRGVRNDPDLVAAANASAEKDFEAHMAEKTKKNPMKAPAFASSKKAPTSAPSKATGSSSSSSTASSSSKHKKNERPPCCFVIVVVSSSSTTTSTTSLLVPMSYYADNLITRSISY
jgi:hypothetical protein